jgi:hypothetical protein
MLQPVQAVYYDGYFTNLMIKNLFDLPEQSSAPGTPATGHWYLYTYNNGVYVKDDAGTATNLLSSTTLDAAYTGGQTITLDAAGDVKISASITGRNVEISNTFAGTQASLLELDSEADNQAVTDALLFNTSGTAATITDAIDASDAGITNALNVGGNVIVGTGASIDFSEFDVSGTTGSITIDDDGDAGSITIEGTVLDINSLDFVGAGAFTSGAGTAITINPDGGNAAGEDLIVTAHNLQLTATGALTLSPDAAVTTAITITDTDYTNALSVGDNAIIGTTGVIDYTNFDVDAAGAVTCTALDAGAGTIQTTGDITCGGTITATNIAQDGLVAASADTTLTLDGTGSGGVSIGTASGTGAITLGGSATQVTLPATVDLVLSGGDITATDTANADMVTITNDTMTTADLLTLSAAGTRTSNNVVSITDGATTATTVAITANTQTSGSGISYTNTGAALTGAALNLSITDGAGFTGDYIRCYDGAAEDFTVERYGEVTIAGNAGADMLTITAGDLQMSDGYIDIDDGYIAVNSDEDHASNITRNYDGVGTSPVLTVTDDHASSTNAALHAKQDGSAGTALKVEQTGTGNAIGIDLDVAGDYPAIDIDASAARDGDVIDIAMANMLDERALAVSGAITAAAGEGTIEVHSTGQVAATGSLIRIDNDTAQAADGSDGFCLSVDDDTLVAATPNVYAVLIDSAANEALHVATGTSLFDELATFTSGIDADGDVDIDFSADTEEMTISTSSNVAAGVAVVTIESTVADVTQAGYLLELRYADDDDTDADFLICADDSGVADDQLFVIDSTGGIDMEGNLDVAGNATVGGRIENTPVTFTFDTEGDLTATLTSSVILLDGDDDADNDTIDLQDGTTAGQILYLIAAADIDADDTCTINFGDTTATNAPSVLFDKIGENVQLLWTGTTWVVISLQDSL